MAQISSNQIIFDYSDFVVGAAKNNAVKGIVNPSNQLVSNFDPFRNYGVAQPGKNAVNATNNAVLVGAIVAAKLKNDTLAYGVDGGGKFHEYDYSANVITNAGVFPTTLSGTTPIGQDVIIYKHNSGGVPVFSPFFSWYNTVNWNIGCFVNYTGTPDDDYMSTIPATPLDIASASPADGRDVAQKSAPHPMEIGSDDILYIGSGRYLHAYDGATGSAGTFSSRVLTLPQGFTITSLLKSQDKLLIAGVYSGVLGTVNATNIASAGEALVYVWNYIDLDVTQVIPLDDPYVSAIFSWRGRPCVITIGESEGFGTLSATKLKIISGNTAEKVAEFQGTVLPGGIDAGSRVLYVNANGIIYAIGDNIRDGYSVNQIMSCVSTGVAGWIKNIVGNVLLASGSTGSTHSQSRFLSTSFASSARLATCYYQVPLLGGMKAQVSSVQIEYYSVVTDATVGLTLSINYDMNAGASGSTVISALRNVVVPAQKIYTKAADGSPFKAFSTIALDMIWSDVSGNTSTVQVSRIIVNYKLVAIGA